MQKENLSLHEATIDAKNDQPSFDSESLIDDVTFAIEAVEELELFEADNDVIKTNTDCINYIEMLWTEFRFQMSDSDSDLERAFSGNSSLPSFGVVPHENTYRIQMIDNNGVLIKKFKFILQKGKKLPYNVDLFGIFWFVNPPSLRSYSGFTINFSCMLQPEIAGFGADFDGRYWMMKKIDLDSSLGIYLLYILSCEFIESHQDLICILT